MSQSCNLSCAVRKKDRIRGKVLEVWMPSFDWRECRTNEFIEQKLHYMHANPCRGKWNLATSEAQYAHSSAAFYLLDESRAFRFLTTEILIR